jgi:hypothetical protein
MIKLIGLKRMIFLAVMLTLNISAVAAYFFAIGPMLDDVTTQKASIDGQISELHGKIDNVKQDRAFVNDNLPKYNDLKDKGFFLPQDRFMIGRTMEDLRVKAGISNFAFSVADVEEIPNKDAADVNYKLINSRINVDKIVSPLDANIFVLAQEMAHVFPDYARIQSMNIRRSREVNEEALKDIAAGKQVNFVDATLEFEWITMVPKPDAAAPGGAQAGFRGR